MKIWILFHGEMSPDYPEYYECVRLQEEARRNGDDLEILSPDDFDLVIDATDEWRAIYKGRHIETPDLIIPRTGAETNYVAFSVLRFYESLKVPMINNSLTIETVADKVQTGQMLAAKGFPIPRTILGKFPPDIDLIEEKIGFPLVVKTLRGTRGGGVFLAETKSQFKDLTDLIAGSNPNVHFLFQEYIGKSHGRDLRVFVAGKKVVACMERQSADGNFKSNISLGGHGTPFQVNDAIESLALGVARTLGLDMAGIDLLFNDDIYEVCEANSSPGFKGLETYCGVNVAQEILNVGYTKVKERNSLWSRFIHPRLAG
jgi:gamma-F420-2:alpha-L-glutamate ligase